MQTSNSSEFDLNGGLLSTTNITAGRTISTATTGTLELTANSNIVLNSNSHYLHFADSHLVTWTTAHLLPLLDGKADIMVQVVLLDKYSLHYSTV